MSKKIKISIIMPSLNVSRYIRQCMDSVIRQTFSDVEIICIDAGSSDGTLEILQDYEQTDPRIQILTSDRKSYGYQMNLGIDRAQGEYIGIVETDDWAETDMFQCLYQAASRNDADVVWSNFFSYYTDPDEKNEFFENLRGCTYNEILTAFDDHRQLFSITPAIWAGIYKRDFLQNSHIRFNETPGASYQDASFHFMVCTAAKRIFLLRDAFLHYRRDNENSSVNSEGKTYCICDEMDHYEKYIREYCNDQVFLMDQFTSLKLDKYLWNYHRIAQKNQWTFYRRMIKEFSEYEKQGLLKREFFTDNRWRVLQQILHQPLRFYLATCKGQGLFFTMRDVYLSKRNNAA